MEEQILDTPGPVIEHERPPLDPTPEPSGDGRSELERHKAARGYTKPAAPTPEAPPLVDDTTPEPVVEEPKKPERWNDPDTGDTYDMRHKVARRIKKVLEERATERSEKEALRRERDDLLRQLAQPKVSTTPTAPAPDGDSYPEPDPADTAKYPEGQYDRAFIRDQARWAAKETVRAEMQTARTERELAARQAAEHHSVRVWQETIPAAKQKYPDFEEVLGRIPNTPKHAAIVQIMLGSPVGNDVVYVLGTQPEALKAYENAPSDTHRLRLLHHLEAQLIAKQRSAAPKPSITRAPLPTSPVHAGAGPSGPIDWSRTDDPDQLQRWKSMRKAR